MSQLRIRQQDNSFREILMIKGDKGEKGDDGIASGSINDTLIDGDHTWSSSKESTELDKKVDKTSISTSLAVTTAGYVADSTALKAVNDKVDTVNNNLLTKAEASHTHTKSQITDFPSTLPANGGNADTVDNIHISVVTALPASPDSSTIYFVKG